jgi:hypothetical protein
VWPGSSKNGIAGERPISNGAVTVIFPDIDDGSGIGSRYGSIVRNEERFNTLAGI